MTEQQAVEAIRRAILNSGPRPEYHREVMARHRREWPTLWKALDALLKAKRELRPDQPDDAH